MKKAKKYQVAGKVKTPKPFVQSNAYATSGEEATMLDNSEINDYAEANPAYKQPAKTNPYTLGDFFGDFNPLAQITTGVANSLTDYKNRKQEQQQYLDALRTKGYENFNEDGLNKAPIYFKNGGGLSSEEAYKIISRGSVNGHKVTARQKRFFELVGKGKSPEAARAIIDKSSPPQAKTGWIQGAINPAHKGYCTPESKSTCTPARKALAERFKHGDLHKGKYGIDSNMVETNIVHAPELGGYFKKKN